MGEVFLGTPSRSVNPVARKRTEAERSGETFRGAFSCAVTEGASGQERDAPLTEPAPTASSRLGHEGVKVRPPAGGPFKES